METRAAMPRMRAILDTYLQSIEFQPRASVLEVGCGSGAIAEVLTLKTNGGRVVGTDPSGFFIERAKQLRGGIAGLPFRQEDGKNLSFPDSSFDVVVLHTVLSHIPQPELVLAEAQRVLRPGGWIAAFDGDYATINVSAGPGDPLALCIDSCQSNFIHDIWLGRRLPTLMSGTGFTDLDVRSHTYFETAAEARGSSYLLTLIDRGAESLRAAGLIGESLRDALQAEARRRIEEGSFFGRIEFISAVGRKP
jgi:ubiquinone/menaquinone biosynthesis C-methylase UbiE